MRKISIEFLTIFKIQESAPQSIPNLNRSHQQTKSPRYLLGSRGVPRPRTFNHGTHDPV